MVGDAAVGVLEPLLEQRFQLAHVLEAQVERLEAGDGGLGEIVAVQFAHRQPDVALGEAELYPALFERLGELLELLELGVLFGRRFEGTRSGCVFLHLWSVCSGGAGRRGR